VRVGWVGGVVLGGLGEFFVREGAVGVSAGPVLCVPRGELAIVARGRCFGGVG